MKPRHLSLALTATLALATSAGPAAAGRSRGRNPPPPSIGPATPAAASDRGDGMQVEATYGQLPEEQVAARLSDRMPAIKRCFDELAGRLWFLSGSLALKGRVARDGSVKSVTVTQSSIGSNDVERCIIGVIKDMKLPPPQGGEGEFTCPVEFTSSDRARQVATWPEARVAADMARHQGEVTACLRRRRPLRVTVYIGPGGKVASVGLDADEPIDDRTAACLVKRASEWLLPDPLGQLVKASYAFH